MTGVGGRCRRCDHERAPSGGAHCCNCVFFVSLSPRLNVFGFFVGGTFSTGDASPCIDHLGPCPSIRYVHSRGHMGFNDRPGLARRQPCCPFGSNCAGSDSMPARCHPNSDAEEKLRAVCRGSGPLRKDLVSVYSALVTTDGMSTRLQ